MNKKIEARLNYLRKQIKNENISYGEIAELQSLTKYIDKGDLLLLQWAGVPEFEKEGLPDCEICKKCGTNNCGNDTTNLQCYEPKN